MRDFGRLLNEQMEQTFWASMEYHMHRMTASPLGAKRVGKKKVPCDAPGCADRRIHHERPDVPRGTQYVEVKANHAGPAFCSISCMMYYKGMLKEKGCHEEIY